MVRTQFGAILKEFESFFHCQLEPDANDSCLIQTGTGVSLQIELNRYGFLLIGCRLGSVHMGRYRNELIRAALKSNASTPLSSGILGFSHRSNQLILFTKIDPGNLSPHQISLLLPSFITKAKLWTEAIAKGEVPTLSESGSKIASGIFGLIR